MEVEAQTLLEKRHADRERLRQVVADGKFIQWGGLYYAILDERVDGELAPALLPNAELIMLAFAHGVFRQKWEVKLRAGLNAKPGLNIQKLGLPEELGIRGRWDAQSNRRIGGTTIDPEIIAETIDLLLN